MYSERLSSTLDYVAASRHINPYPLGGLTPCSFSWVCMVSRELVDSWFDAFRERDISKLELAEDFVHTSPYGEIKGRDAYLDLVGRTRRLSLAQQSR
jgi:hypothetical protein